MSKVYYNNILVLSGQPSPFVARIPTPIFRGDGRRIGVGHNFQLNGVVTGCSFDSITGAMGRLNSLFSKDFGTLKFIDDNGYTVINSGVKILKIGYAQGIEVGIQDYVVDTLCYPESYFENAGVIEKKNDWSVNQEVTNNLTITHDIFARGVNTAPNFNNALTNAKNFVLNYTGFNPPSLFPFFISGFSGSLDSRTESINRLEGTYHIVENYIGRTGSAVSQDVTVNLESGSNGIILVNVQGTFKVGKNEDFNLLRQTYSGFDIYGAATGEYNDYRGGTGLQIQPLSSGVTESYQENSLNFSVQFTDWPQVFYRHIFDIQISSGANNIITTSINGNIEGLGKLPKKYDNAFRFFTGLNIYSLANNEYLNYVNNPLYPYPLRAIPLSSGTTDDRFAGTISYNVSFDNRTLPLVCSGIKFFDVTISKQLAVQVLSPKSIPHSVQGLDIVDLGYKNRSSMTVQGSVTVLKPRNSIDATGFIAQYVNNKFASQFLASGQKTDIRLDSVNISQDIINDSATFSVQYSFDEPLSYVPNTSYNFINSLSL